MPNFEWLTAPKFQIGDHVWVGINKNKQSRVWQDVVVSIWTELFKRDDAIIGMVGGYRLNSPNLNDPNTLFHDEHLYTTQEGAMLWSSWIAVEATEEEWFNAIGSGDPENEGYDNEEPELAPGCCGQIGLIRDYLFDCKENGGMTRSTAKRFQTAMNNHESLINDHPNLDKIFKQLGVTWQE